MSLARKISLTPPDLCKKAAQAAHFHVDGLLFGISNDWNVVSVPRNFQKRTLLADEI